MHHLELFQLWFAAAKAHPAIPDATAMTLATCAENKPSLRVVLLKEADERGFTFYTNMQSRKGDELHQNPQAALCFYWEPLGKQVRIEGSVAPVDDVEADAYFQSRPRESQIGAWASQQSRALESRAALMQRFEEISKQYEGKPVPRPPHWSGWRLVPGRMEFWQAGAHRLHDREVFTREAGTWSVRRLYP